MENRNRIVLGVMAFAILFSIFGTTTYGTLGDYDHNVTAINTSGTDYKLNMSGYLAGQFNNLTVNISHYVENLTIDPETLQVLYNLGAEFASDQVTNGSVWVYMRNATVANSSSVVIYHSNGTITFTLDNATMAYEEELNESINVTFVIQITKACSGSVKTLKTAIGDFGTEGSMLAHYNCTDMLYTNYGSPITKVYQPLPREIGNKQIIRAYTGTTGNATPSSWTVWTPNGYYDEDGDRSYDSLYDSAVTLTSDAQWLNTTYTLSDPDDLVYVGEVSESILAAQKKAETDKYMVIFIVLIAAIVIIYWKKPKNRNRKR